MSKLNKLNALAATIVVGALGVTTAHAANPFAATDLAAGYQLAGAEGACGSHGGEQKPEGKCGEGKCGEGKCGADKAAGEGKCGAEKKPEGKCGEGKCGEGKCGGEKTGA